MKNNSQELQDAYSMVIQQARNSLVDFEIATNPNYEPNWHHDIIGKELEHIEKYGDRDYKILIVTVPPRHGKSQQASIDFPAWYLGRNPQKEVIISSYSSDLAQEFGGKTRNKINSVEYKQIFPGVKLQEDDKSKGKWKVRYIRDNKSISGGGYLSSGVGGSITGFGADIFLIDDPLKNREEAESKVIRDKVWDWFTSTAFTRLHPKGVVVIMMTRWHLDDLAGRIIAHEDLSKRTRVINLEAISQKDEHPYRGINAPLWAERYDMKSLLEIKSTVGPYDWAALFMGSPVLTENQEFKPHWYKYKTEQEVMSYNSRRFLTVDTAMSKKAQADFTAFCDNRINSENFWHIKTWQAKIGPEELIDALFSLHAQNRYEAIGIEKTSYTEGLKPYLDAEQRKRNKFLPIVELTHKQVQKEIRIRALIPLYASGTIFHIDKTCKDLEEQFSHFPSGIHDDLADAVAYQLQITSEKQSGQLSIYIPD